jgi:hypothetical protein
MQQQREQDRAHSLERLQHVVRGFLGMAGSLLQCGESACEQLKKLSRDRELTLEHVALINGFMELHDYTDRWHHAVGYLGLSPLYLAVNVTTNRMFKEHRRRDGTFPRVRLATLLDECGLLKNEHQSDVCFLLSHYDEGRFASLAQEMLDTCITAEGWRAVRELLTEVSHAVRRISSLSS